MLHAMLQSLRAAWYNIKQRQAQKAAFRNNTRSYVRNLARFNSDPTWIAMDVNGNLCRHRRRAVVVCK